MTTALDPQRSIAVAASAGSGKTWLLVSRIVRLLIEGAEPGGILALTFTRKAAAEMRERVNDRLKGLAYGDEASITQELSQLGLEVTPARLARARSLYEQLLFEAHPPRALTLHSFCQDLLARFALEAEVSPGFKLIEAESALWQQAWRRLLETLHAEPQSVAASALRALIEDGYGEWALRDLVFEFFAHRGDWWAYVENRDDPLAYAQHRLLTAFAEHDDELIPDASDAEAAPDAALAPEPKASPLDYPSFSFTLGVLWRWLSKVGGVGRVKPDRLEPALEQRGDARYTTLIDALFTQGGEPYAFKLGKTHNAKLSDAEAEHFTTAHAQVIATVVAARARRWRAASLRRTMAGLELGVAALHALEHELTRERALSFTEIEWRVYRLLRADEGAEWVRYKLDRQIDHLLIDEFQDTSPTQWRLLLPVLEEMAAGDAGRGRSAFIVGDAKQSIYGFRRANPELLETAAQWLEQRLAAPRVPLNASRRSAPAIIDFVNKLFEPEAVGGAIAYVTHSTWRSDDPGRVELAALIDDAAADEISLDYEAVDDDAETADNDPSNVVELPERPPDACYETIAGLRNPLTTPRDSDESRRSQAEGRLVTLRIKALIESGVCVRGDDGARAIGYGDVMVLSRSRTHLRPLEDALTEAGIPFIGSSRGTLLDTSEGQDLLALLRFLNSPHRALDLAQVLRSPLFSCGEESLIALATEARADGDWLRALRLLAEDNPLLNHACRQLSAWLSAARRQPAHDLLDRIFCDGDVAARYEAALPPITAARVRANLGALAQLALDADSGRYPSLSGFIRYLEGLAASAGDAPDEAPPPGTRNAVRIMTIHAAKGLEAAAVFIVNTGRMPQASSPTWLIDWPPDADHPQQFMLAPEADARDEEASRLLEDHRRREAREELNLLYVAATRARQFLHISGFQPGRSGRQASWHDLAREAMRRLVPATDASNEPLAAQDWPGVRSDTTAYDHGEFQFAVAAPAPSPEMEVAASPTDPRLRQPLVSERAAAAAAAVPAPAPAPHPPAVDAISARAGTAIHLLLQWLSEDHSRSLATLTRRLAAELKSAVEPEECAAWLAEAQAVIEAPALAGLFNPAHLQRAWNEVPVSWTVDGVCHQGVIDRLVDDGAQLWIIDYKTTSIVNRDTLQQLHAPQLQGYAQAIEQLFCGRPYRAGLILTAHREWLELGQGG